MTVARRRQEAQKCTNESHKKGIWGEQRRNGGDDGVEKIQECEENMSDFISCALAGRRPQTARERWSGTTSAVLMFAHSLMQPELSL